MSRPRRLPSRPPGYVACAVALLLVAATASTCWPTWFVAPGGRIAVFGGPIGAMVMTVGLWRRSRLALALTVAAAVAWTALAVDRYGEVGEPAAQLLLGLCMAAVVGLLTVPPAIHHLRGQAPRPGAPPPSLPSPMHHDTVPTAPVIGRASAPGASAPGASAPGASAPGGPGDGTR